MNDVSRRSFLQAAGRRVLGCYAASAGLSVMSCGASERKRPNILLVISDDQSWIHAGAYGCEAVRTPNFDRVARMGVLFNNAFSAAPQCTVSRAALLTGRNIWQNEEAGNHWSNFPRYLKVYPELLQKAGYEIGYTGKGWGPGNWEIRGWPYNPAGPAYNEIKLKTKPTTGIKNIDYAANFRAFLQQNDAQKPFCFWFGTSEPHGPYEKGSGLKAGKDPDKVVILPHEEDTPEKRSDFLDYFLEIEWYDRQLGQVLDLLEEKGQLDNTLIVVTGDNGTPMSRAKGQCYEYGCHVPMAVAWPNRVKSGRRVDDIVSFIDLAPTFLESAGLTPIPAMTGRSIMNMLLSEKSGRIDGSRTHVLLGQERGSHMRFDNLGYPMRAIRDYQYLYIWNIKPERWPIADPEVYFIQRNESPNGRSVDELPRDYLKRPSEELYDIQKDPSCLQNLARDPAFAKVLRSMREQLKEELKQQKDPRVLGYGDVFDSYPRYGPMREYIGGFKKWGQYNPKYHVHPGRP